MKVLIVDDEPDIIYLLQKRLRSMDWKYLLLTTARRHLRHSAIAMFALSQQTV
jgi:CheY-like chemotaxis protein